MQVREAGRNAYFVSDANEGVQTDDGKGSHVGHNPNAVGEPHEFHCEVYGSRPTGSPFVDAVKRHLANRQD